MFSSINNLDFINYFAARSDLICYCWCIALYGEEFFQSMLIFMIVPSSFFAAFYFELYT